MMNKTILQNLNPAQLEAVTSDAKTLLVLAGAGSGKTRVLVHRIAWLIQEKAISPYAVLAVTFTNKAANEMRSRVETLLDMPAAGLWIGTFHGLAHRLLRAHWEEAKLPQMFQILDSEDQYRLIRRTMKSLKIDEGEWQPKQVQWFINSKKDEGLRPHAVEIGNNNIFEKELLKIYAAYEAACEKSGLVDFAELLLRSYELLAHNPQILNHYQQRFEHILVDEFQDTNTIQYAWLQLLTHEQNSLMLVGDDDQSIYSWRGAKVEHLLRIQHDYPKTEMVRLEQNYRSTGNILNAANALIKQNGGRLGKTLWTDSGDGDLVSLYAAYNDRDEARFIIHRISEATEHGHHLKDCAILYRSNAQSRVIEEALLQMNLPYRVFGGMRFFERAEIKDALAYLRLTANKNDDPAFERIINVPTRGIGDRTVMTLREYARDHNVSLWQAAHALLQANHFPARTVNALMNFINLIEQAIAVTEPLSLHEKVDYLLQSTGLIEHYQKEKGEKGQARIENLEELINAAQSFESEEEDRNAVMVAFLSHAALESGENQADPYADCVQLMTLHAAKGLEFPIVFLTGLEENLFPHQMSYEEPGRLEEERRLCYVGMTRAQKKLVLTYAQTRRLHGRESIQYPSRFLEDVPDELIDEVRKKTKVSPPLTLRSSFKPALEKPSFIKNAGNDLNLNLGQRVVHQKFGEGVIVDIEGSGPQAHLQIRFTKAGTKWLVAKHANLQTV